MAGNLLKINLNVFYLMFYTLVVWEAVYYKKHTICYFFAAFIEDLKRQDVHQASNVPANSISFLKVVMVVFQETTRRRKGVGR